VLKILGQRKIRNGGRGRWRCSRRKTKRSVLPEKGEDNRTSWLALGSKLNKKKRENWGDDKELGGKYSLGVTKTGALSVCALGNKWKRDDRIHKGSNKALETGEEGETAIQSKKENNEMLSRSRGQAYKCEGNVTRIPVDKG